MTTLRSSSGTQVVLGRVLKGGGEALIYEVVGRRDVVAKVFRPAYRAAYPQKLQWMIAHPPLGGKRAPGLAWPMETLFVNGTTLAGYVMPRVDDAVELLDVLNPRRRAQVAPGFDLRYLHRTARNLAAVMEAVHAAGYVIGDVNERNVLVGRTAEVTLVDTDSFQVCEVRNGRRLVYPCPVGRLEYSAPERLRAGTGSGARSACEDTYSLGVLTFQLLMGGSHPFRARWGAPGDVPELGTRVMSGCFPHQARPPCPASPPAGVELQRLHPRLQALVQRCFVDGHHNPERRPAAAEWRAALEEAERALACCRRGHWYSGHLTRCPECAVGRRRATVARSGGVLENRLETVLARVSDAWALAAFVSATVVAVLLLTVYMGVQ
ncbi:MAG: hypothetical protein DCC58_11995 [Chloroflexi bacterium]|nr:MAG: hypothetical protein DCC58_11995 [Chloroflexota bacterium]